MKRMFLVLPFVVLASCSTPQTPQPTPEKLPSASTIYPSPDGQIYATIRHSRPPFTVVLVERNSERILGTARSSIRLSEDGEQMHGQVRVTYADDLATIVVHEEFSDASPNPRYILFRRIPGADKYRASYFAPPTAHTDAPGEFNFISPKIQRVTSDTVTLDYDEPGRTRVFPIRDLLMTSAPRSSQEWPSEAYEGYVRRKESGFE